MKKVVLFVLLLFVVSCNLAGEGFGIAWVDILDAKGNVLAKAKLEDTPRGVAIELSDVRLPDGEFGYHIHGTGVCTPPAFASAGSHWDPQNRMHGLYHPQGPHKGDLRNLIVKGGVLQNPTQLVDQALLDHMDGKALVIHEKPDDYKSQPSGNAGARIGCGVI